MHLLHELNASAILYDTSIEI